MIHRTFPVKTAVYDTEFIDSQHRNENFTKYQYLNRKSKRKRCDLYTDICDRKFDFRFSLLSLYVALKKLKVNERV